MQLSVYIIDSSFKEYHDIPLESRSVRANENLWNAPDD